MDQQRILDDFLDTYSLEETGRIRAARVWAGELHEGSFRASGEPAVTHPDRVGVILADMGMDADSVIAGVLHHALEDGKVKKVDIEARCGPQVAMLVDEIARMAALKAKNKTNQAAETIRKMLFAMTADLRVIIVKLADKLDNMRTLRWLPTEDRRRIAAECVDIFAPLADRLGISWMKDELEDLALKEINREAFDQIKLLVSAKKLEREAFLARAGSELRASAKAEDMNIQVTTRAKHFYSIYQKMRKRSKGSDELFDLSGVRVLCDEVADCYAVLGIVHRMWKPIDGRFKDYIAMPKSNGYMSLHTTVMAYEGLLLEVQIRTHEMHRVAEFGVASHWLYKKGLKGDQVKPGDLSLVNRLKDWSAMLEGGSDFLDDIKRELLKDSIFVFTPKGDAIELPAGSTPLDFAYAIHSDVGNRCLTAKAGGAIIPLDSELRNTQVVEILTSATARPNVNWLRAVKTSKARSKIRQWLVNEGQVLTIDRNVVARRREQAEARSDRHEDRSGRPQAERRPELEVRHDLRHEQKGDTKTEAKGEARGEGRAEGRDAAESLLGPLDFRPYIVKEATDSSTAGLHVAGAGNLMVRFAACCNRRWVTRSSGMYPVAGESLCTAPHARTCRASASFRSAGWM